MIGVVFFERFPHSVPSVLSSVFSTLERLRSFLHSLSMFCQVLIVRTFNSAITKKSQRYVPYTAKF